ncbi:hypothetical protein [Mycoplasmoides pirum]|uniref:hypothetical protein n=1 Tax=Mycoplasmoides pirum TaxID=2122 RepID=UPI0004828201|nr:hypothetical protein [Mycoplasmoides pirum]
MLLLISLKIQNKNMSYYSKSKFVVSNHARLRIKERLKLDINFNDLEIDVIINEKLSGLKPTYQKDGYEYYKIPETKNLYAIVLKNNNLITTVTNMLPSKIKKIL